MPQRCNHFVGMNEIARKDNLGRNMRRMEKFFPQQYDFFPKTYMLPADYPELRAEFIHSRPASSNHSNNLNNINNNNNNNTIDNNHNHHHHHKRTNSSNSSSSSNNNNSKTTYIVKPDASSQGKGIYLTRSLDDIDPVSHMIVQKYLHNVSQLLHHIYITISIYQYLQNYIHIHRNISILASYPY